MRDMLGTSQQSKTAAWIETHPSPPCETDSILSQQPHKLLRGLKPASDIIHVWMPKRSRSSHKLLRGLKLETKRLGSWQ